MPTRVLFTESQVDQALQAMGEAVQHLFEREETFLIVGIQSGGMMVARRLQEAATQAGFKHIPMGSVDTTLYRDDIHKLTPEKGLLPMEIPVSVEDAAILLVDDVIFTGRSARAAMDALFCLGRPRVVRLAVLVDRGHRELPIQPDIVGFRISTDYNDDVVVSWNNQGGKVELTR